MNNFLLYALLIIMTMMGSAAALFLKKAASAQTVPLLIKSINLYIGGGLYLGSAIINIFELKYLDYSTVLPLTSITYIWTMILAYLVLKEKITKRKMIGVAAIICGVWLIIL